LVGVNCDVGRNVEIALHVCPHDAARVALRHLLDGTVEQAHRDTSFAPLVPVPIDGTPAGEHRIVRDGSERALELAGKRLWVSTFEPDIPIDFEMANLFTATHPRSRFTQGMWMRAFTPDGEIRVRNREVTIVRGDASETYQLADRKQLRALVAAHFGFDLPALETLRVPLIPEWT